MSQQSADRMGDGEIERCIRRLMLASLATPMTDEGESGLRHRISPALYTSLMSATVSATADELRSLACALTAALCQVVQDSIDVSRVDVLAASSAKPRLPDPPPGVEGAPPPDIFCWDEADGTVTRIRVTPAMNPADPSSPRTVRQQLRRASAVIAVQHEEQPSAAEIVANRAAADYASRRAVNSISSLLEAPVYTLEGAAWDFLPLADHLPDAPDVALPQITVDVAGGLFDSSSRAMARRGARVVAYPDICLFDGTSTSSFVDAGDHIVTFDDPLSHSAVTSIVADATFTYPEGGAYVPAHRSRAMAGSALAASSSLTSDSNDVFAAASVVANSHDVVALILRRELDGEASPTDAPPPLVTLSRSHPFVVPILSVAQFKDATVFVLPTAARLGTAGIVDDGGVLVTPTVTSTVCGRIARDVAKGLSALHERGDVHGVVRPETIVMSQPLEDSFVTSAAASASCIGGAESTQIAPTEPLRWQVLCVPTASASPSPPGLHFTAPEVLEGAPRSIASDAWAFGATLYCLLFGRVPFAGQTTEATREAILTERLRFPPESLGHHLRRWRGVLEALLERDPEMRLSPADLLGPALDAISA